MGCQQPEGQSANVDTLMAFFEALQIAFQNRLGITQCCYHYCLQESLTQLTVTEFNNHYRTTKLQSCKLMCVLML